MRWTVAIKQALEPKLREEAKACQVEGGRSKASAKVAEASKGRATDKATSFGGHLRSLAGLMLTK